MNASTPDGTIVVNGQRYVLVPERTFQRIEQMTAEVPALRQENAALKTQEANSTAIIDRQAELIKLKDATIAAQDRAIAASEKALELEKQAGLKDREALGTAQKRIVELEGKVKRANRRALWATIGAGALVLLRFL